ncbi:hypothetical protein [Pseudescherichia sp. L3]|uniref:hypothetical protein n=1 Tax=Pseudescherichia sp. L3 TaxID=2970817 RepID=UPI00214FBD5D|nr:hypothetical protein [Pseudescherichia sp. L3]MCR4457562.1 hypothetical protein [Pseudescherichia sp. L3]
MAVTEVTAEVVAQAASGNWTFKDLMYAAGVSVAVVSSLIACFSSWMTARRDRNSLGDSEIKLYELISKSIFEFSKFQIELMKKADEAGESYVISKADDSLLDLHIETVLNAYDIACQRYLDGKLDKTRFESTYKRVIGKLFENPLYQPVLSKRKIQYSALNKVNDALNDLEK